MSRTFTVPMTGTDVEAWQHTLNRQMNTWRVDYRLNEDGVYGAVTRDLTASVCHGMGLASASRAMRDGVTPELRVKLRNKHLTAAEKERFRKRAQWRKEFRARHASRDVASPLAKILADSWGYGPGHDGVDLICSPRAAGLAICKARVLRADNGGWWGKGAPSAAVAAKGDGVVVLECLVDVGPFKPGLRFVYGHAEHVRVRPGEIVEAGQVICEAGFARAWHFHFCVNGRSDAKGVGDRDPLPFIRFAQGR